MTQNKIFALFISVAILVGSCSRKDTDFTKLSTNLQVRGTITGKVVAKDGKGIPGVAVIADDGTTTTTTFDGYYSLGGKTIGGRSVTFFKEDFIDTTIVATVHLVQESVVEDVKLRSRFSTISGILVDASGKQIIPGATIAGVGIEGQAVNKSSFDGTFTLEKVEAGELQFMAVVDGRGFGTVSKVILPDSSYPDLRIAIISEGGTVDGVIQEYDITGKLVPVSGAHVSILSGVITGTTDANGVFKVKNVPSNSELSLSVRKISGKDTLSAVVGGVSVYEKGSKSVGKVILTNNKNDGIYSFTDGYYTADLSSIMKINVQSPVAVVDPTYAAYRYQWDFNDDGIWDTTTSSSRIALSKQTHWNVPDTTYRGRCRLISVRKNDGYRDTSAAGKIAFDLTATKIADAELLFSPSVLNSNDTIPDTIGVYLKDVSVAADVLHIEFANGTIVSAKLTIVPSNSIQILKDGDVLDILAMPGAKKLTAGSTPVKIAEVVLTGLVAGKTVTASAILQANGVNIPFETIGSVVVK